jgi:osmoprotectant transport system permease protein
LNPLEYAVKYYDRLLKALFEHVQLVLITLVISLLAAAVFTVIAMFYRPAGKALTQLFSAVYSIPSLALFAIMMPVTGLGRTTSVLVLVFYNQYLLIRNFVAGLNEVDPAVVESATGMGMSRAQVIYKVRLPIAKKAMFVGVRLAVVSTIAIATIAAYINAGGLGKILLEGMVSSNTNKIIWGSILSAGFAIATNAGLVFIEKRLK